MSALVFLDTETTGLSLDDDIWEFAAVRREENGRERDVHLFIQHDTELCQRLPESFRADHQARFPASETCSWSPEVVTQETAAYVIQQLFVDRAHVVGAVPNFDTERLAKLLDTYGWRPGWHHHLIDVEALAVGYLYGCGRFDQVTGPTPDLPWDSDDLSRLVGVEPPTTERHTAMGDARWAMALYDAITGRAS